MMAAAAVAAATLRYDGRRFDSLTRWPCCRGLLSSPPADVDGASAFVWGVPPAPSSASEAEWPLLSTQSAMDSRMYRVLVHGTNRRDRTPAARTSHFAEQTRQLVTPPPASFACRRGSAKLRPAGLVIISFTSRVRTCTSSTKTVQCVQRARGPFRAWSH